MSSMTHTALSDCSYPESDNGDIKGQIANVFERLKIVIQEQDNLRQSLKELFDKQESDALEELKRAEKNLEAIRQERIRMEMQVSGENLRNLEKSPQPLDLSTGTHAGHSPSDTHISLAEEAPQEEEESELSGDGQLARRLGKELANLEREREGLLEDEEKYKKEEEYWKMIRADLCNGGEACQNANGCHCPCFPCQCAQRCQCTCHTSMTDAETGAKEAANIKMRALSALLSKVQSRLWDINGECEASNRLIMHLLVKDEIAQPTDDVPPQDLRLGGTITIGGSVGKSKSKKRGKAA